jgi:putative ABC transport system permease protein
MWTGHLKTALSSLSQSRWRTTFTMLGIIIGICSVVTIVSLGEGLKNQILGQINQLGSDVLTVRPGKVDNKKGSITDLNLYSFLAPSTLTTKDVSAIKSIPGVGEVVPINFVTNTAKGDSGEFSNLFVAGSNSKLSDILHQNIVYGSFYSDDDNNQNFAVIGSDVSATLFGVLNPVGSTIHIVGQDFIVHGVLAPSGGNLLSIAQADLNSSILIPMGAAQGLAAGHTNILQIFVKLKPGANVNSVKNNINKTVTNVHEGSADFTVLTQKQLLSVSDQLVNAATSFLTGIAAISLLVGSIGIMNIMLVSVSERTREIGIRKAIGATNRQILNQFLVEGLVLSIGGGIIGIGVSYLINLLLRLYSNWKPIISLPILLLAVGVSITAGVLFSMTPAFKAARKDPITALRGE